MFKEVLSAVESADDLKEIQLSEDYLRAAGQLARKRAAFAAWRLAGILNRDIRDGQN